MIDLAEKPAATTVAESAYRRVRADIVFGRLPPATRLRRELTGALEPRGTARVP